MLKVRVLSERGGVRTSSWSREPGAIWREGGGGGGAGVTRDVYDDTHCTIPHTASEAGVVCPQN